MGHRKSVAARSSHSPRVRRRRVRHGFTLIETSLTIIILGVGILAIMSAQQAFHQKNDWSTHASVASFLGNEIREMTLNLPRHDPVTGYEEDTDTGWGPETNEPWIGAYDDLDDFDNWIFDATTGNGPINARREVIVNMDGWSQEIHVTRVDMFDINNAPLAGDPYLMKVDVIVQYEGPYDDTPQEVTRVSWIAPK